MSISAATPKDLLLTAEGCGTAEIMRVAGIARTAVWRWQERFMRAGVAGLLRDKTRPSRIPLLDRSVAERVIALTLAPLPAGTPRAGRPRAR